MKTLFNIVSTGMLLLALFFFLLSLKSIYPTLEETVPGMCSIPLSRCIGTVAHISSGTSTINSVSSTNTSTGGVREVTINFLNKNGDLFSISCNPIINPFKIEQKVPVFFRADSIDDKWAAEETVRFKADTSFSHSTTNVMGTPDSLFCWVQWPLFWALLGSGLLVLRWPVGQMKKELQRLFTRPPTVP